MLTLLSLPLQSMKYGIRPVKVYVMIPVTDGNGDLTKTCGLAFLVIVLWQSPRPKLF